MIERLALIGVGLVGASLARALRRAGHVREIVGYDRTLGTLDAAVQEGIIERAHVSIADCIRDADVTVIAVPVGGMNGIFKQAAHAMAAESVITDVGSVKGSVVTQARATLGARFASFVPGHPLAGLEQSGLEVSSPDLFDGRRVILTPEEETEDSAVERIRAMWQAAGAEVVTMSALEHDRVLAASSHLPHVLAYVLVDMLVRRDDHRAVFDCAAGGFRDFTRIAASDPGMWRDICLANRDELLAVLGQYRDELSQLLAAVEKEDSRALMDIFTRAQRARETMQDN